MWPWCQWQGGPENYDIIAEGTLKRDFPFLETEKGFYNFVVCGGIRDKIKCY